MKLLFSCLDNAVIINLSGQYA